MDTKGKQNIKIEAYRKEDLKRIFSNYVEVSTTEIDVSIRFADVKPPRNKNDVEKAQKEGVIKVPVDIEVVIPLSIAKELTKILRTHLEVNKGKNE